MRTAAAHGMKQKTIDKRIAWERFFDAVQAVCPHVLDDLHHAALTAFKELLLGKKPRKKHTRKRDRAPLARLIADAPMLKLV